MPQAVAAAAVWVGQVVGTAIGGALTAVGVAGATALPLAVAGATAAYYVAELAIYAGLQSLIDDISNQKAAPFGQELQLRVASDIAREMIIGERAVAGSCVARYSYGNNLYNASFVYQLADHRCEQLSKVYGDGRLVRDTPLSHGVRTEITAYSYSGGARVWMTWHDGRVGQSYDAQLVTKSALDPDVVSGLIHPWTTSHVGAGCAYVHIEVQWDSDILTSIPEFLFLVKGAWLYDRRKDTTAGGSGSHRLDNPGTWQYSANAAVALDHYLLGYMVEGDPLAFGVGLSPLEIPYAQFAQSANLCDEDVDTGEGGDAAVMKRYEVNGIVSAADAFESVLTSMQNQMGARIVDLGGRIGIIGAEEQTATIDLNDLDWASDESVRFADKLDFSSLYGAVIGSYADPANMFQPTPYERQTTAYLALPDGGEATTAQLDLPYETNSRRAVRLASAWIKRESLQPRIAGTLATRSLAWKLEAGDWVNVSSDRWQFLNEKFEVVDVVKHGDFTVTLSARAINPNFLAFPVDQDPDLGVPPTVGPAGLLLDTPTFSVVASTLTASGVIEPCLEVTLTSDEEVARELIVEYGVDDPGAGDVLGPTFNDSFHISQVVTKIRKGILPTTNYRVRMRTKAGARESDWTTWSSMVTTGTSQAASALLANGIIGQGWGATASEEAARATRGMGLAKNSRFAEPWTGSGIPPKWAAWNTGAGTYVAKTSGDGNAYRLACAASVQGGASQSLSSVAPGDYLLVGEATREVGTYAGAGVFVVFYNAGSTQVGSAYTSFATEADTTGGVATGGDHVRRWEKLVTAPAGTVSAAIIVMGHWTTHGSIAAANQIVFYECDLIPMTLVRQLRADITNSNISSGFTGQDWGATASEAAARATRGKGLIRNSYFQEPFTGTATPPGWANWSNGTGVYAPKAQGDGNCFVLNGAATLGAGIAVTVNAIQPSTNYLLMAEVRRNGGTYAGAGVLIEYYNASSVYLGSHQISFATDANTDGLVNIAHDGTQRWEKVCAVPAGTTWAQVYAMNHWSGHGSVAGANSIYWYEVDLIPLSLVKQLRADVTGSNVSSGFTNQGGLATGNYYEASSDPGSVPNGSFWFNTSNSNLYVRRSGAWGLVANISGAASQLWGAPSPETGIEGVSYTGFETVYLSGGVARGGGAGGYTYAWARTGGNASIMTNPGNSQTITGSIYVGGSDYWWESWVCTITDTAGTKVSVPVPVRALKV